MLLDYSDGQQFATGAAECSYRKATSNDRSSRLMVPISINGRLIDAVIDTGGLFFVCTPEIAAQLGLYAIQGIHDNISIRGDSISGTLCRLDLSFEATDDGNSMSVDVTAFIPDQKYLKAWALPPYIGWTGCLERIRFAIDPPLHDDAGGTFYFGPM